MILGTKKIIEPWASLLSEIEKLLEAGQELNSTKIQESLKYILPTYQPRSFTSPKLKSFEEFKVQA